VADLLLGGSETHSNPLITEEQELDGSLNNCTSPLALYFGPLPSSSEISIHTLQERRKVLRLTPLPLFCEGSHPDWTVCYCHCFVKDCITIGQSVCLEICVAKQKIEQIESMHAGVSSGVHRSQQARRWRGPAALSHLNCQENLGKD
jgi:hypothetical protein